MEDFYPYPIQERPPDPKEVEAQEELKKFFEEKRERVFCSQQLLVMFEEKYYHWITSRALTNLIKSGVLRSETHPLTYSEDIKLIWNKSNRYYKRITKNIVKLVDEYSKPDITRAVGYQGENLVLRGFSRNRFILEDENTRKFRDKEWTETHHNLDFIFSRDLINYGVEVKNTLSYIDKDEFDIKIKICEYLGLRPVFVVRMLPKDWIDQLRKLGGFTLVLKYQFYPLSSGELVERVKSELGLPVSIIRDLEDGTMRRFLNWHDKNM